MKRTTKDKIFFAMVEGRKSVKVKVIEEDNLIEQMDKSGWKAKIEKVDEEYFVVSWEPKKK